MQAKVHLLKNALLLQINFFHVQIPHHHSVLYYWLGDRKGIRPVKT